MAAIRHPGYRCEICGARFTAPYGRKQGLAHHVRTQHKHGQYAQRGDVSLWKDSTLDGRWQLVCDRHGQTVCFGNLKVARSFMADAAKWCEVCSGSLRWCKTCEADERPFGMCDDHDVIDDSLSHRKSLEAYAVWAQEGHGQSDRIVINVEVIDGRDRK